jgi:hypothetical protein
MPNPVGAPTDYKPEYCQMLVDYFSVEPIEKGKIITSGKNYSREEDKILFHDFPTFEGFAFTVGVLTQTLEQWAKKYKEFSEAYACAKQLQKKALYRGGLSGVYNSNVVALIASHEHKIHLRQEIEDKTPQGNRIFTDLELAARLSYLIEMAIRRKKEQEALELKKAKEIPEKIENDGHSDGHSEK